MLKKSIISLFLFCSCFAELPEYQIIHQGITQVPRPSDTFFWGQVKSHDIHKDLTFQAVHNNKYVFILFTLRADNEYAKHKLWKEEQNQITVSRDLENRIDFIFGTNDSKPQNYDYWFWSSIRTETVLDDRHIQANDKSLTAKADAGKAPYTYQFSRSMMTLREESHKNQLATGSRADVNCKNVWQHNYWRILIWRKLDTKHSDDIPFKINQSYQFFELKEEKLLPQFNFTFQEEEL